MREGQAASRGEEAKDGAAELVKDWMIEMGDCQMDL